MSTGGHKLFNPLFTGCKTECILHWNLNIFRSMQELGGEEPNGEQRDESDVEEVSEDEWGSICDDEVMEEDDQLLEDTAVAEISRVTKEGIAGVEGIMPLEEDGYDNEEQVVEIEEHILDDEEGVGDGTREHVEEVVEQGEGNGLMEADIDLNVERNDKEGEVEDLMEADGEANMAEVDEKGDGVKDLMEACGDFNMEEVADENSNSVQNFAVKKVAEIF